MPANKHNNLPPRAGKVKVQRKSHLLELPKPNSMSHKRHARKRSRGRRTVPFGRRKRMPTIDKKIVTHFWHAKTGGTVQVHPSRKPSHRQSIASIVGTSTNKSYLPPPSSRKPPVVAKQPYPKPSVAVERSVRRSLSLPTPTHGPTTLTKVDHLIAAQAEMNRLAVAALKSETSALQYEADEMSAFVASIETDLIATTEESKRLLEKLTQPKSELFLADHERHSLAPCSQEIKDSLILALADPERFWQGQDEEDNFLESEIGDHPTAAESMGERDRLLAEQFLEAQSAKLVECRHLIDQVDEYRQLTAAEKGNFADETNLLLPLIPHDAVSSKDEASLYKLGSRIASFIVSYFVTGVILV